MIFNMVGTAVELGYKPDEFFDLPSEWKAILMTYNNIISKMKSAKSNQTKVDFTTPNSK